MAGLKRKRRNTIMPSLLSQIKPMTGLSDWIRDCNLIIGPHPEKRESGPGKASGLGRISAPLSAPKPAETVPAEVGLGQVSQIIRRQRCTRHGSLRSAIVVHDPLTYHEVWRSTGC